MFGWLFKKKSVEKLEEETKNSFNSVKDDFKQVSDWIKHLDNEDEVVKQMVKQLKDDLASIKDQVEQTKEVVAMIDIGQSFGQVSKKPTAVDKQTAVDGVQKGVQTAVQTANFYDIFNTLSANERLIVFTLMNAGDGMKMSYEDLALLLGKERSTIRGQINAIKQKSEGLIEEMSERNGKKRVYVPIEMKEKLQKYAKVRVREGKKAKKDDEKDEKSDS
jgi:ABC-type Fe3+-hydroxamate transport system substrate-binding protein